jgi:N-acyl-D-amino-acid deacylase
MRSLIAGLMLLLAGCASAPATDSSRTSRSVDLLITNGRIVDGTGNNWFEGDVAVSGGRIVAIGSLKNFSASRSIDAGRRIVAPGFIDTHAHIEFGVFDKPTADNYVQDGVTTVITGNCGGSADSIKEFFTKLDSTRTSINVATLVGHNTVRRLTMGLANRPASPAEQQSMEALVEQGMKDGAVGLSTGLIYLPGMYSNTEEVVGLAKAAHRLNGIYASHIRNEGNKVADAINEAINIGKQAHIPVQISHFKVSGNANWGRSKETLAIVEQARRDGYDVTIDQYPYTASSTNLGVLLPDWALEGGTAATNKRINDAVERKKIIGEILDSARRSKRPDFSYAVVAYHAANPALGGKSISQINLLRGRPATMEQEVETILELMLAGGAQMVYHGMNEDDVRLIMKYPFAMIGADGGVQSGRGVPHPRSYGTNARVLGKYVREEQLVTLEDAIRRMTSLAAQKFQLKDRGMLREGYAADIVIFDEKTVADRATFENPHQFSVGFEAVIVNGQVVVDEGRHTGARPGNTLKGPGYIAAR